MDKINEENKEIKKIRKYADKITMGMMEDADIPLPQLKMIFDKEKEISTKDLIIMRKLANACMIEGEPFERDSSLDELPELVNFKEHFLAKSRLNSAKEKLKQQRSPKR